MNSKAAFFFAKPGPWQEAYRALREIILDCHLTEDLKWGCPCYTFQDRNVLLIHGFKEYCAVLFFKGVLLKDPEGMLVQQTEHVQASRQIRFTDAGQIRERAAILKAYIYEAVEIEESGVKVPMKQTKEFAMPEEFQQKLHEAPDLKMAFEALTPGRQRAYLLHFAQPKQSRTRVARIEKAIPQIMDGKGLNDD